MKTKIVALLFAFCLIIAGLLTPQPAAAYSGVNLIVRDSITLQGWQFGGDVYLVNQTTGTTAGTAELDGNGEASITFGNGPLCDDVGGCVVPTAGQVIEIVIDFECQISANTCGGPNGTPQTFGELTFTQNGLPFFISRDVRTGTGPLAVNLTGLGSASSSSPLPYVVAGLVMMMGVATIFVMRRRWA